VIIAVGKLGISITPFIAAFGGWCEFCDSRPGFKLWRGFHHYCYAHVEGWRYNFRTGLLWVGYSEDPDIAISMIKQVIVEFPAVSVEPVPQVGIEAFGDSSIVIAYRFWVPTRTFVEAQSVVNRRVFKALNDVSVPIPLPQREVRVLSD
jgi:hypothetical protein